ncbi:MAG: sulfatase-like hydrolase/transferase [Cardiobacteriaceae bacterium]|nr:sulfatase-like hydrolase/transferase [Cardiobacteriaceae bacterium]
MKPKTSLLAHLFQALYNPTKPSLLLSITLYLGLMNGLWVGQSAWWVMIAWVVLMTPFLWLPARGFKVWLSVQLLIASVALFVKSRYQVLISEDILLSALLSEADLTAEMFSWQGIVFVSLVAGIPMVVMSRLKLKALSWQSLLKQSALLLLGGLLLIAVIFHHHDYHFRDKGHIRDSRFMSDVFTFSPVDALYNFHRAYKSLKKMKRDYLQVEDLTQRYHYQSQVEDLLVVVVLGESTRGDHFSLLGYPKQTNPRLSKIPDLYPFLATSCDTLTINSLHCLASPLLAKEQGRSVKQSSFGQIFRYLGYQTHIYSLQTLSGFYAYLGYDTLISKYQITAEQADGARDRALLPYVLKAIASYQGGKQLIIAHTLGSHQTYADRINPNLIPFQPYCQKPDVAECSREDLGRAYDNTVVAVDDFLADIIEALRPHKALLLYVSDHGESLGEDGHYFHGQPVQTAPKEQFSIPMVWWFSESYRNSEQGALLVEKIKQAFEQKLLLSHDEVFHSILGCAGVVSYDGGLEPHLNLCHLD